MIIFVYTGVPAVKYYLNWKLQLFQPLDYHSQSLTAG